MGDSILLELHRSALEIINKGLAPAEDGKLPPGDNHSQGMLIRSEELSQACSELPGIMEGIIRILQGAAFRDPEADLQASGEEILQQLDGTFATLDNALGWLQEMERAGLPVAGSMAQLDRTREEARQVRDAFLQSWPWIDEKMIEEALVAQARGESLDLDDAFAGIAGVDKSTWLKKVEEYKKKKHS